MVSYLFFIFPPITVEYPRIKRYSQFAGQMEAVRWRSIGVRCVTGTGCLACCLPISSSVRHLSSRLSVTCRCSNSSSTWSSPCRGRGRLAGRLPDGLDDLGPHNLISFKSHREALDAWAVKELIGHSVTYRKLVSSSPSELLPEDRFRLFAVCARFPHNLSGQVPWQQRQAGVYDCQWGTDVVRVVVAGQLPREPHNAPLHLFSASPELVGFGRTAYRQRSEHTSRLLRQLFERYQGEEFVMPFTMEDFDRWYTEEHFIQLTPAEQPQGARTPVSRGAPGRVVGGGDPAVSGPA